MNLPVSIKRLIESFERLPGIGPKTAQRLGFYLLHVPQGYLDEFAKSLTELKKNTIMCSLCNNVAENDPCPICSSRTRDKATVCVVEQPLDIFALEKTGEFRGVYYVLHGAISPLNNIGPDELFIPQFLERIKELSGSINEIILATNPTMEGEATAMFISEEIKNLKKQENSLKGLKVTRLGLGLPTGGDLEYADEMTLTRAIEGRRDY
ncbi:MAG: recombination mediator RecR [Patescibacteria group bacterium]